MKERKLRADDKEHADNCATRLNEPGPCDCKQLPEELRGLVDWLRDAAPVFGIGRSGREIKTRLTEAADYIEAQHSGSEVVVRLDRDVAVRWLEQPAGQKAKLGDVEIRRAVSAALAALKS